MIEMTANTGSEDIMELERETKKEREMLLAMIMERQEYLEKRERDILEREKSLMERERKLEETKEKLLNLRDELRKKKVA